MANGFDGFERLQRKELGGQRMAPADAVFQTLHKSPAVDEIRRVRDAIRADGEIDRSRDGAHTVKHAAAFLAQFPGELENHIAAQRIANGEQGKAGGALAFAGNEEQIAGLARMIVRARVPFGIAASAHVVAMYHESFFERGRRHADGVARLAGAFQAVDQDYLALRIGVRTLHAHQNAHAGLGLIVNVVHRPAALKLRPFPEIARDGGYMRIPKEGTKGARMEGAHRSFVSGLFSVVFFSLSRAAGNAYFGGPREQSGSPSTMFCQLKAGIAR